LATFQLEEDDKLCILFKILLLLSPARWLPRSPLSSVLVRAMGKDFTNDMMLQARKGCLPKHFFLPCDFDSADLSIFDISSSPC
jgi:hypothetical protein